MHFNTKLYCIYLESMNNFYEENQNDLFKKKLEKFPRIK